MSQMCWYLRLPHRNDAKIAKICNLWTFWLIISWITERGYKVWPHQEGHTSKSAERGKMPFLAGSYQIGLLELQANMSRGCRFLLFWHHSYEVTLSLNRTLVSISNYKPWNREIMHLVAPVRSHVGPSVSGYLLYMAKKLKKGTWNLESSDRHTSGEMEGQTDRRYY